MLMHETGIFGDTVSTTGSVDFLSWPRGVLGSIPGKSCDFWQNFFRLFCKFNFCLPFISVQYKRRDVMNLATCYDPKTIFLKWQPFPNGGLKFKIPQDVPYLVWRICQEMFPLGFTLFFYALSTFWGRNLRAPDFPAIRFNVDPLCTSLSYEYEFRRIRYNIGGIRTFLHFSFCVKLKIETLNTCFLLMQVKPVSFILDSHLLACIVI